MSEYLHVEKPFLDQLAALGWQVVDQGQGMIPADPAKSLRTTFREWLLPEVFRNSVRAINLMPEGKPWLTDRQLDDLRDQILRQPNRTLIEANETTHRLFLKAQVDRNEVTGESDPVVKLIDFVRPERNQFHAINQFRVDTPGCVKSCIIPDIVLFVNGIPLVVVEAKIGDPNTANPLYAAYEQLLRYRNGRPETLKAGLREGEPRLFYTNLLLVRTCGEQAEFGTITSGHEHFYTWKYFGSAELNSAMPTASRDAHSGTARAGDSARCAAHLHGVHGHRRGAAYQGCLPLSAVSRRPEDHRAPSVGQNARIPLGRRLAHAGLGQIAHDGLRRADATCGKRPRGLQDSAGQ